MSQNLSSAAVVICALRVRSLGLQLYLSCLSNFTLAFKGLVVKTTQNTCASRLLELPPSFNSLHAG